jgi:polysaccharide biosynthesis/export protein
MRKVTRNMFAPMLALAVSTAGYSGASATPQSRVTALTGTRTMRTGTRQTGATALTGTAVRAGTTSQTGAFKRAGITTQTTTARTQSGATRQIGADYLLGPDDVIEVTVRNHDDLNKTIVIRPDGKFAFPYAGEVQAGGRTARALAADIQNRLARSLNHAVVMISVKEVHSKEIHVIGQVSKPGAFDLKEGLTVVSLLAQAGGASEGAALRKAYILRGSTQIPVDLQAILVDGNMDERVTKFKFQADDVLVVPENQTRYGVLGQVAKPGYFPFPQKKEKVTVLQALVEAGGQGQGEQAGNLRGAGIIRVVNGTARVIPVNIEDMLKKGRLRDNAVLQPDDVLYIPPRHKRFNWNSILSAASTLSVLGIRVTP